MAVSGVRSSCEASATNRRIRCSDAVRAARASAMRSSMRLRARPSRPTSLAGPATWIRSAMLPAAMAWPVSTIRSFGPSPRMMTNHVALVDLENGVAETARRRRRPTPSQDRPHPRDQLFDTERLGEIVVTAPGETGDPVLRGVAGGEEHHRRLVTRRPQPPAHSNPVDARQADVEHHDVGVIALDGGVG